MMRFIRYLIIGLVVLWGFNCLVTGIKALIRSTPYDEYCEKVRAAGEVIPTEAQFRLFKWKLFAVGLAWFIVCTIVGLALAFLLR